MENGCRDTHRCVVFMWNTRLDGFEGRDGARGRAGDGVVGCTERVGQSGFPLSFLCFIFVFVFSGEMGRRSGSPAMTQMQSGTGYGYL